jgi:Icc-related predicted phosphoesterase
MKVVAISDLHGFLPKTPECDLLLIAGDICPYWDHRIPFQAQWLNTVFRHWLQDQPAKHVVAVFGNHDLVGQEAPNLVPKLKWHLLQDQLVVIDGVRIYGLPWQRTFSNGWAFNLDEPELDKKYEAIPECDIIVSHGPPFGFGDNVPGSVTRLPEQLGSKAFRKRIMGLPSMKLVVFGHIHEGRGVNSIGQTAIANVTHVDENYNPIYLPMEFEL